MRPCIGILLKMFGKKSVIKILYLIIEIKFHPKSTFNLNLMQLLYLLINVVSFIIPVQFITI